MKSQQVESIPNETGMGEAALFRCMSYDVFPVLRQSDQRSEHFQAAAAKSFCHQFPLEHHPAFPWMNAVPQPLPCSRTCTANDTEPRKGQEPWLLCCEHKLSPKLAEKTWVHSQLFVLCAECLTLEAGSVAVSEEETPLSLNNSWTSGHLQRRSWAALWCCSFLPLLHACRVFGQTHRPQTGLSVSCTQQPENKVKHHLCQRLCSSDRKQN